MLPSTLVASDLESHAQVLARRRYGRIVAAGGQLEGIEFRLFPRRISIWEHQLFGRRFHARRTGDRAWIDYNHPRRHSAFLAVAYFVSTRDATLATCHRAITALEKVARLKGCDAILCDAANSQITEALLRRYGFEPHAPMRWHRNYIKRLGAAGPDAAPSG